MGRLLFLRRTSPTVTHQGVALRPGIAPWLKAAHYLAKAKMSSRHAVDALVAATALEFGTAVIATGDPSDMQQLLASNSQIEVFRI